MILKIWDYAGRSSRLRNGAARQRHALETALGCASYIVGLHRSEEQLEEDRLAGAVAQYLTAEQLEGERIRKLYSSNLSSWDPEGQVREIAFHTSSAGIEKLRHMVWSHRFDEQTDDAMMDEHRAIIAKVMQVEKCPSIGADHGDTDYDHHHEAVVAIEPVTGRSVEFGQGWWQEAAQIAVAVCEFRSGLKPEPNRRYIADETGVYHTFSDIKIANADGIIPKDASGFADRALVRKVQKAHTVFKKENEPVNDHFSGEPWKIERAIAMLAGPRIKNARCWEDVHRSLARVGMRYVKVAGGAQIHVVGYGEPWDRNFSAGTAGSGAAYGKLKNRRKFGEFEDAPEDLVIRGFVMPTFNEKEEEDADQGKDERQSKRRSTSSKNFPGRPTGKRSV